MSFNVEDVIFTKRLISEWYIRNNFGNGVLVFSCCHRSCSGVVSGSRREDCIVIIFTLYFCMLAPKKIKDYKK